MPPQSPLWFAVLAYVVVHGPELSTAWAAAVERWAEAIARVRDTLRRKKEPAPPGEPQTPTPTNHQ